MKIKIVEPGWAGYTGLFGCHEFEDGVSVDELSKADAAQLAALVAIENVADNSNPSVAQLILDSQNKPAPVETVVTAAQVQVVADEKVWTADELAAEADKGGIKAIRAISGPRGLRGTSIAELIGQILTKQAEAAKVAADAKLVAESEAAAKAAAEQAQGAPAADPGTGEPAAQ
jgi:hypothetical protein